MDDVAEFLARERTTDRSVNKNCQKVDVLKRFALYDVSLNKTVSIHKDAFY